MGKEIIRLVDAYTEALKQIVKQSADTQTAVTIIETVQQKLEKPADRPDKTTTAD